MSRNGELGGRPVVLFTNSPHMGGMEEHVLLLAGGLVARGIRTATVCSPRPEIQPLREALTARGVTVHTPSERRTSPADAVRRVRELAGIFRRYRGGILHVHSTGFHGGELVMLAGQVAGMAAVVRTEHVPPQPPVGARHRLQVRVRDRLLLDKVICVSEGNRREHEDLLGRRSDKLTVVLNGIDADRFSHEDGEDGEGVCRELGLAEGTPLVGVVARLAEERKGISEFLRMAAEIVRSDARSHFLIVGEGPLRPQLEQEAVALGLSDRVTFLGARPDVPRMMAAMTIFVMPSLYEGGPLTLLEAMAMGTPVVSTSVGFAPDVVEVGTTGYLVPPGDPAALAHAVTTLVRDEALTERMGRQARARAEGSFSSEHQVDATIAVYRSVL
jgi:glycosyltransferase involved in cell wall biosynthesis